MNIEEIKKEILQLNVVWETPTSIIKEVIEILNNYNNQPDYKSAFEQIKREYIMYDLFKTRIEQIEQKYNLGGE